MKAVLAPDSFKGALSAREVVAAMTRGLLAVDATLEIVNCPMADGGEGTLDAVAEARECERLYHTVTDANGERKRVPWLRFEEGGMTAGLIEVASIVGLPDARIEVADRTTQGVGELVLHLLDLGIRRIFIGLGGTSTNEAGVGALAALGARFIDATGQTVAPTLAGVARVASVDFSGLDARLAHTGIILLTDVTNPLCGAGGATAVFGPQKGVLHEDVAGWDARIARLADQCDRWFSRRISLLPGSGAAGGLGYGLMLAGGSPDSGAKRIAGMAGLPEKLKHADLLITGEGRSDRQTLMGKVPAVVAELARAAGIPACLVSGAIDASSLVELSRNFRACIAVSDPGMPLAEAMAGTAASLELKMGQVLRCLG